MSREVISPTLLNPKWDDTTKFRFNSNFDLGMSALMSPVKELSDCFDNLIFRDFDEICSTSFADCEPAPPAKRVKLSLSASGQQKRVTFKEVGKSRFAMPVNSLERQKAAKGVVPANTESSTQWAV